VTVTFGTVSLVSCAKAALADAVIANATIAPTGLQVARMVYLLGA
jgi:hypothetical protein